MVMSMFSVFDPVVLGGQFNWVVVGWGVLMVWGVYYYVGGMVDYLWGSMKREMKSILGGTTFPFQSGLVLMGVGLLLYLVVINLLGLFPYIFCGSAQPFMTVGVGLLFWSSCFLMGWAKSFFFSVGHLTPEGSPLMLAPVLVVIELVSHLIRPMTLSIRLAANMMAGHLIVGLISSISVIGGQGFVISVLLQMIMMVLELGVCFIQGVVFSLLVMLYAVEYY